jgi:hypothetical protein
VIHPFLVDLSGDIYVYSFNDSNNQWFVNFTISLGFSLVGKIVSNYYLNQDNYTDLVLFNKLSDSDTISFYTYDSSSLSYDLNQSISVSSITLPEPLPDAVFKEYLLDFTSDQYLTMYACVSNSSNEVNYVARLNFDTSLTSSQENDATQLYGQKVHSAMRLIGDKVYFGAINPSFNGIVNSSMYSIDKELTSSSLTTFETAIKGAIIEINSFACEIGEVVVAGISMNSYNEEDIVLYYILDTSTNNWYKTEFSLDTGLESFASEIYDFKIYQIVNSKEEYFESVLIASSQGLWKTTIDTGVITLSPTPIFYAVDAFRSWDLFEYELPDDLNTALVPLSRYPAIEIINVYEFDKYRDYATGGGAYIYDSLREINPSGYKIGGDKKQLICYKNEWHWINDADIYYEVRYLYEATVAEASGLLSAQYNVAEYEHVGNVAAKNAQMRADKLAFQLLNPNDPSHWTFYYGTRYDDWNYQFSDVTTGHPYILSEGDFWKSGINSASDLSSLTEFDNNRMDYGTISTSGLEVSMTSDLAQFETGQDFYRPDDFQSLYENSYIDSVWAENLTLSTTIDLREDIIDFSDLTSDLGANIGIDDVIAYKPDIVEVAISGQTGSSSQSDYITYLTDMDNVVNAWQNRENAASDIDIEI